MIELCHVTAGYPGRPVLEDVNLAFQAGKITALIGPNGCGKDHAAPGGLRAAAPGGGTGALRRKGPAPVWPQGVCPAGVHFAPDAGCALHPGGAAGGPPGRYPHLSFGRDLTQADREKIAWAMEVTGTTALKDKELSQLSGGERQRVYLAMTLSQDTDILFLDEPTTYLDIGQKYEMLELIAQVNAMGKTVVMVLHGPAPGLLLQPPGGGAGKGAAGGPGPRGPSLCKRRARPGLWSEVPGPWRWTAARSTSSTRRKQPGGPGNRRIEKGTAAAVPFCFVRKSPAGRSSPPAGC